MGPVVLAFFAWGLLICLFFAAVCVVDRVRKRREQRQAARRRHPSSPVAQAERITRQAVRR